MSDSKKRMPTRQFNKEQQIPIIQNYLAENPGLSAYSRAYNTSMLEHLNEIDEDAITLIPLAKRILMYNSNELSFQQNCDALRFIMKYVFNLTPAEFDSSYNITFLKNYGIKNICNRITEGASEKVLVNNGFYIKNTLIECVWPEYHKEHIKSIQPEEIFYCAGTLKGSLCRAAKPKIDTVLNGEPDDSKEPNADGSFRVIYNGEPDTCHGTVIDKLVYNSITEYLIKQQGWDSLQILEYLANPDRYHNTHNTPLPGVFKVIEARSVYANALDFYMFNSPIEFQKEYIHDYINLRHEYFKDSPNDLIERIYEVYCNPEYSVDQNELNAYAIKMEEKEKLKDSQEIEQSDLETEI